MATADHLNIRNVDPDLWTHIRVEALRHNLSAGALLNTILREWLAEHTCAEPPA